MKKILAFGDNPLITTGFAQVAKQIYEGLNAEYELHVFGILSDKEDYNRELGYFLYPNDPVFDPHGLHTFKRHYDSIKPDILFFIAGAGTIYKHLIHLGYKNLGMYKEEWEIPTAKIIAYTPVEGMPTNRNHLDCYQLIHEHGGLNIFWTEISAYHINQTIPWLNAPYSHFGADHGEFKSYKKEDRDLLRKAIGWDNKFIITSVGTNKRTKGWPSILYVAKELKDRGYGDLITFYLHTDPDHPIMDGYDLKSMAHANDVADMVIWKPNIKSNQDGIPYYLDNISYVQNLDKFPISPEDKLHLFTSYSYISKLNCTDLYLDLSQIEGWGLPQMEAMSCGVPTLILNDYDVRREIFNLENIHNELFAIEPLEPRLWDTWHSGVRLVNSDPKQVADKIIFLYENQTILDEIKSSQKEIPKQYKWKNTNKKILNLIRGI